MMKRMIEDVTLKLLEVREKERSQINSCIGFDGFVDQIFRVVKHRHSPSQCQFFQSIEEFADYIKAASGKSSDIEIFLQEVKLGGNAAILANALANLGSNVKCIGTFGINEMHDTFQGMPPNCKLISIGEPAYTHAFEFKDGKLMFGQIESLHQINWEIIKNHLGLPEITRLFKTSDLIAIVNWSAISQMRSILAGIMNEVFPNVQPELLKNKFCFFDIADPSLREPEELRIFLNNIGHFSEYSQVILSLNEKEAEIIFKILKPDVPESNLQKIGRIIFDNLKIHLLVIHMLKGAIGFSKTGLTEAPGFYVENPKISTGGGDNFNAGFCMGRLLNLSVRDSLLMGNATSSFYVTNGMSPNYKQLVEFFEAQKRINNGS